MITHVALRGAGLKPPRLAASLWLAIAAIISLSVGAYVWVPAAHPQVNGRYFGRVGAINEYRQEERQLELAPGWSWPTKLPFSRTGPGGERMYYQEGFAAGRAATFWFCSWATTALSPASSAALRQRALSRLPAIRTTSLFTHKLIDNPSYINGLLEDASSGKTRGLAEFVRANCTTKA